MGLARVNRISFLLVWKRLQKSFPHTKIEDSYSLLHEKEWKNRADQYSFFNNAEVWCLRYIGFSNKSKITVVRLIG
jgi:hypothetical protein